MNKYNQSRLEEFDKLISGEKNKELNNMRVCKNCGRRILREGEGRKGGLCPMCAEQELFCDVRDYIRANDVKDYEVAEKFGLPLAKVKEWIKQGRIQYKNDPTMKNIIMGNYCQICGSPTNFGTICPKCMKEQKKANMHGVAIGQPNRDGNTKMRFMEDDKK